MVRGDLPMMDPLSSLAGVTRVERPGVLYRAVVYLSIED